MTKSDLIERLSQLEKLPKGRAEQLVNIIFDAMEQSLRRGERIEIRGFGSFEIRNYRAYEGRNPRTGSTVPVRPKRLPFFKVGKELKERVNEAARRAAEFIRGGGSNGGSSSGAAPNGTPSGGTTTPGSSGAGTSAETSGGSKLPPASTPGRAA